MKRSVLLLSLLLCLAATAPAQSVSYRITEDDPYKIRQLFLTVNPFFAESFRTTKAAIGGGLEARLLLGNDLVVQLNNWKSYLTINEGPEEEKFITRDLSASWLLLNKEKKGRVKVNVSEGVEWSHAITVPGTWRVASGFRGGVFNYQAPLEPDELKKTETIPDTNGIALDNLLEVNSVLRVVALQAGLVHTIIRNTQVDVDGYGHKSSEMWLTFYADLMFAPVMRLQDFEVENYDNSHSYFDVDGWDNGILPKRFGWRLGSDFHFHTTKPVTFSSRVEIGSRPGIRHNGFYLYWSGGVTFALLKRH